MKAYLEPADIEMMERVANCLRDRLLIRLLFRLGCRVSEALAVKVSDIDFERGTVTILHLKTRIRLSCPKCKARLVGDINSVLSAVRKSIRLGSVSKNIGVSGLYRLIGIPLKC